VDVREHANREQRNEGNAVATADLEDILYLSKRLTQPSSSLGQNLSLSGLEDDYYNLGCDDSQIFGRTLSFLSWGTPCPPVTVAFELSIDHTNLEYLITDYTCSNLASFFTHHLHHQHQQ